MDISFPNFLSDMRHIWRERERFSPGYHKKSIPGQGLSSSLDALFMMVPVFKAMQFICSLQILKILGNSEVILHEECNRPWNLFCDIKWSTQWPSRSMRSMRSMLSMRWAAASRAFFVAATPIWPSPRGMETRLPSWPAEPHRPSPCHGVPHAVYVNFTRRGKHDYWQSRRACHYFQLYHLNMLLLIEFPL